MASSLSHTLKRQPLLLAFLGLFLSLSSAVIISSSDTSALLSIKSQITDPLGYLSSWKSGVDCSSWIGVTCTHKGRVTVLNLAYAEHAGNIPAAVNSLSQLQHLYLEGNFFKGTIPNLSKLKKLRTISLTGNLLTGTLQNLGSLPSIINVFASANKFTGGIPSALISRTSLSRLELAKNLLSGSIPAGVSKLTNLVSLLLESNQLAGPIPNLQSLSKLQYLNATANRLTGTIPKSVAGLASLRDISLGFNKLTGGIPITELHPLRQLRWVSVENNSLTGPPLIFPSSPVFIRVNQQYNFLSGFPIIPENNFFICIKSRMYGNCIDYTSLKDFCAKPQRSENECYSKCRSSRPVTVTCASCPARSPCGVGRVVINAQKNEYLCICPRGYATGALAATGKPTCVPASRPVTNFKIPRRYNFTCRVIYENFGMSKPQFVALNPKVNCGRYPLLTKVNINVSADNPICKVFYRIVKGDTCASLEKRFGIARIAGQGSLNPDLDCCNLKPGGTACLASSTSPQPTACQERFQMQNGDTCQSVIDKYFKGNPMLFYALNPTVYCDALARPETPTEKKQVCIRGVTQGGWLSKCNGGATASVVAGDTCATIYKRHFQGNVAMFKKANSQVSCRDNDLFVGMKYCSRN